MDLVNTYVPFVDEVIEFNKTFGKLVNETPTIASEKDMSFIVEMIEEETKEFIDACKEKNIVEILDAYFDLQYFISNIITSCGLRDKVLKGFNEVHLSNLSKACNTEEEAEQTATVRSKETNEPHHWEIVNGKYIVYRSRDKKVAKNLNYFKPNLKKLFTDEEISNSIRER